MGTQTKATTNEPYCSHCGYALTGLTESSKCPECGRPLVEVLARRNWAPNFGKRYRSKATLFGLPVIDVALGPKGGELRGKAKGIIAVGDIATGWLAVGGFARGGVAVGGMAVGLFAVGGLGAGLLAGAGGLGTGALACGGGAVGLLANGGGAAGLVAQGGGAFGAYVRDGRNFGRVSAAVADVFDRFDWFFGRWPPNAFSQLQPMIVTLGVILAAAALVALVASVRLLREPDDP